MNETKTKFFASLKYLQEHITEMESTGWMVRSVTSLHWAKTSMFCVIYEIARMGELRGEG